ncbi:DNA cytosine methyltransferase [Saccharothrix sp. NRRL B-16314]|uniref:DNA cytosine methyltransferase n=1 Tax=Saccharothrix sp. NRRL B-16314 TaxID=1463825 RepID=UPI00068CDE2C|nr:DNA cytosine methyltransferase [Saccharothrix sp. NRRL B-16314]
MTRRYRVLDLFCRAGGASAGYHAAGFDVTGVDIDPQPHYPFPFLRADALTVDLDGYDLVTASPPCQRWSQATPDDRREDHPDLVDPIRRRLRDAVRRGDILGYVIENVPGAPLIDPITICGHTLRLDVRRHRLFESNLPLHGTPCHHDAGVRAVPVYGAYGQRIGRKPVDGETSRGTTADRGRAAMGIDWMPWTDLTQAIPPAYTAWIGVQLMSHALRLRPVTQEPRAQTSRPTGDGSHRWKASRGDASAELRDSVTTRACRCGRPLTRPATGRWPRHCSHACRQAAYRDRTKRDAA